MSLKDDIEAGFDAVAEAFGGMLALGARAPIRCILADGITRRREDRRTVIAATVTAKRSDLGSVPRRNEGASLVYQGETYRAAVAGEDIRDTGGTLYTFDLEG